MAVKTPVNDYISEYEKAVFQGFICPDIRGNFCMAWKTGILLK